MEDFHASFTNSENKNFPKLIKCNNAFCTATNSATITFEEGLDCKGDAHLTVSHSGTINVAAIFHLPFLKCDTLTINADHASTITIFELKCNKLILNVGFASTVTIEKGSVASATGTINHASTGVCHAPIKGANDVKTDKGSIWVT